MVKSVRTLLDAPDRRRVQQRAIDGGRHEKAGAPGNPVCRHGGLQSALRAVKRWSDPRTRGAEKEVSGRFRRGRQILDERRQLLSVATAKRRRVCAQGRAGEPGHA